MDIEITLRKLIQDEQEAVVGYKEAIEATGDANVIKVLTDIMNEELVHIGQLEGLLHYTNTAHDELIIQGAEEAAEQVMESSADRLAKAVKELSDIFN